VKSEIQGLTAEQVAERIAQGKVNKTTNRTSKSVAQILVGNVFTFFNILSFGVATLLIIVGFTIDSGAFLNIMFLGVVVLNMLIGIIQELRAKFTIERLKLLSNNSVRVIRDGTEKEIDIEEIVLDDVLVLQSGNQIPTDCMVLDGDCEVNESLLTGESDTILKRTDSNLLSGSFITSGIVTAKVTAVGNDSYASKIASEAKTYVRPRSELLRSLQLVIRGVSIVIFILTIVMVVRQFSNGLLTDSEKADAVMHTSGAVVGMIPVGMFLLTSLALASGALALSRKKTLVQELFCIEMLARVDTLCLDKTGTLTDGTMKVVDAVLLDNLSLSSAELASLKQSSTSRVKSSNELLYLEKIIASVMYALGDTNQTSKALIEKFGKKEYFKVTDKTDFSSERKYSSVTLNEVNGSSKALNIYSLGATEFITKEKEVLQKTQLYQKEGHRVLLLNKNDKPFALIVLSDTIREDAHETIKWFKENNVNVRVISGDNPMTVSYIARRVGIDGAESFLSTHEMDEKTLRESASKYTIFGRVTPEQKKILINEMKLQGKTVAMTGDGVNDILALREADCSIAMGNGSDATRNASHLILLENNFSALPEVVKQGRRVINNVAKSSSLFMFKVMFSIFIAIFAIMFLRGRYIFEPRNLYILEWLVIGLPSFFLALELNSKPIEGNFIKKILVSSSISALVAVSAIGIIALARFLPFLAIGDDDFLTLSILMVTIVGVMLLMKIARPFNWYRAIVLGCTLLLTVLVMIFLPGFVGLNSLIEEQIILLITLLLVSYLVLSYLWNKLEPKEIPATSRKERDCERYSYECTDN